MPETNRVQSPPAKPLLVYDGDCQFCRRWIARWRSATGGAVDFLPFQDSAVTVQFPEIPPADFEEAVHFISPDGTISRGAEAVFRSLAAGGRHRWMLRLHQKFSPFAELSETLYEEVAMHRTFFSTLDRVYSGPGTEPPGGIRVRWLFLRGLALVFLIAFVSLWVQMPGLIGSHGVVPARELMAALKVAAAQNHLGLERFHLFPTFAWWSASDTALNWQCALGVAGSLLLLGGRGARPHAGSALDALSVVLHHRQSFLQFPMGHSAAGNRFSRDFLRALAMAGTSLAPGAAARPRGLAAALGIVPAHVRIRLRQADERRSLLVEPDRPARPL